MAVLLLPAVHGEGTGLQSQCAVAGKRGADLWHYPGLAFLGDIVFCLWICTPCRQVLLVSLLTVVVECMQLICVLCEYMSRTVARACRHMYMHLQMYPVCRFTLFCWYTLLWYTLFGITAVALTPNIKVTPSRDYIDGQII